VCQFAIGLLEADLSDVAFEGVVERLEVDEHVAVVVAEDVHDAVWEAACFVADAEEIGVDEIANRVAVRGDFDVGAVDPEAEDVEDWSSNVWEMVDLERCGLLDECGVFLDRTLLVGRVVVWVWYLHSSARICMESEETCSRSQRALMDRLDIASRADGDGHPITTERSKNNG
jgi:hypothetical protein